ncbi:MAG: NADH-quinone oxidoreductase subunit L [Nitrososphaerota archaeon]|nr:NADH-quinone oxidoreductase subunit L [Nitrososphaerota archaeon]MDG6952980.1 NADH-quinone oxidoreductase subunit L [Nitrososphaerota archaeon]MDG6957434.1 NADH-quinone oxidoreductase subunit L [Nitrososphaerota archaeon]MDG6959599.1 NADH-quinone oxidoreductase subunit L [Nitrososphaerota archaeon]MDG6965278.1 NADH-quinone oxidoreductase subunit L [Nitrososphaerota archaeon]
MTAVPIPSYFVWLIFLLPYAGTLAAPLTGRGRIRDVAAVLFSFLSAIFALVLLVPVIEGNTISLVNSLIPASVPWIPELGISFGVLSDPYTVIIANLVAWISFLVMLYSVDYMKGDSGLTRYWFFMSFFIGSMQLIVLSNNLLSLFIGWEGVGLCSYALIGYYYHDEKENWVGTPGSKALGMEQAYPPSHAGMKAFFMTRIGDMAMLAGILILFIYSGTFNYQQLASSTGWATSLAAGGLLVPVALLIFGGAVGKSAQFPLQEWLPDAMAGPAPVSALIHAATMVNAGVVLVARIGPIFYFALQSNPALIQPFFMVVAWIGAITAFLAATQAMVGFELKKLLAYSTISQIGYMMLGLGLAGLSTNFAEGLSAGLYQLLSHAIFKAALFMTAGVLIHLTGTKYVNEMGGLKEKLKITFAVFLIAAASLSGIPPLSGFFAKDAILATAWGSGQYGLFLLGSATAGLTAFYAFRMVGLVFYGVREKHAGEGTGHELKEPSPISWIPYSVLAAGTVLIGVLGIFNFQGDLQGASVAYIYSLFKGASFSSLNSTSSFNFVSSGITLAFALTGLLLAVQLYVRRKTAPSALVKESGLAHGLYRFLENRWYINAIYYRVFVDAPLRASYWTLDNFELGVLQRVHGGGANLAIGVSAVGNWFDRHVVDVASDGFARAGQGLSKVFRRLQTGILEEYALVFAIGLILLLLFFLFVTGVYTAI